MRIRPAVKQACLYKYVQRVKLKYSIAFFQWRYKFIDSVNKEQLIENVQTISNNFFRSMNLTASPSPDTQLASTVSFEFEENYKFVLIDDSYIKKTPWFIHSF